MASRPSPTRLSSPVSSSPTSIDALSQEEAQEMVRRLSSSALGRKDLDLIFGSNGKSGRNATGNYSLLAKATGLSRVHISKVLKGKVGPSHETLIRLSEVTRISINDISVYIRIQSTKEKAA